MSTERPISIAGPTSETNAGVFSRTIVMWMVLVGTLSFAAFIVLMTYADELRNGNDAGTHALSKSAVGYARLVEIMNTADPGSALISRGDDDPWERGLNVLTPSLGNNLDEEDLDPFHQPLLVILAKWSAIPDMTRPGWAKRLGAAETRRQTITSYSGEIEIALATDDDATKLTLNAAEASSTAPGFESLPRFMADLGLHNLKMVTPVERLQTMSGDGLRPILTDENGRMILAQLADEEIFILSEPDLANTWGLTDPQRAQVITKILYALRQGNDAVFFDVTLNGLTRSRNLLKLAFEPPFAAATLAAILAAGMMAWRASIRFGPTLKEERAIALGKQALAENTAALIRLARREHNYAPGYADLIRRHSAKIAGAPHTLHGPELNAFLNRIAKAGETPQSPPPIEDLAQEAAEADSRTSLMRAAQRLFQWKQEFDRERR